MEAAPIIAASPASADSPDRDTVTVLRDDGTLDPATDPRISDELAVVVYRQMMRLRTLDEKLIALQRDGKIAAHASSLGEEAAILGPAAMLRDEDWVFSSPREFGAALWRGMPLNAYVSQVFGNASDPAKGHPSPDHPSCHVAKVASVSSVVGTQITHAVGLAWAAKLAKKNAVALAYFGEGATSGGDFHNGMNFAGVLKVPVVFLCRNNGWATSTPHDRQTASTSFFIKGIAYGIPGVRCDGNDVFAVMKVTRDAIARAEAGRGPTLIEAVTQRLGIDGDVARRRDPLVRLRGHLEHKKLWNDERQFELTARIEAELSAILAAAENAPKPALATMFDDVFAELPWNLREQKAALLSGPRAARKISAE